MNWYKKAQTQLNPLNGLNTESAKNKLYDMLDPFTHEVFRGDSGINGWSNIHFMLKKLNNAGILWNMTDSAPYKNEINMPSKIWKVELHFINEQQKPTTLHLTLRAEGTEIIYDTNIKYVIAIDISENENLDSK